MESLMILFNLIDVYIKWRRNPTYSTGSSLRVLAALLLSMIGLLLGSVAVIHLTSHFSQPMALGTILATGVVNVLGAVFVVKAAEIPREAKTAAVRSPAMEQVQAGERKIDWWAKAYVLSVVVCNWMSLVPDVSKFPLLVGGLLSAPVLTLMPLIYHNARMRDRKLSALKCGSWLHWQYSPAQWQEWIEEQCTRAEAAAPPFYRQRDWCKGAMVLGAIIVATLPIIFHRNGERRR